MAKKTAEAAPLTLKPLDDRVVVEPTEAEEKTAGGILLPDTAKQKPQQGKVVAVGPGKLDDSGNRIALAVKVGDVVLYGKYSGSDVEVSGKEFKILRETDILAKLAK
jgi:chaperonin GroES